MVGGIKEYGTVRLPSFIALGHKISLHKPLLEKHGQIPPCNQTLSLLVHHDLITGLVIPKKMNE